MYIQIKVCTGGMVGRCLFPLIVVGYTLLAIRGVLFNDSGTFGYSQQESHVLNAVDEDDGFLKGAIS
jgi:hypothetical protein